MNTKNTDSSGARAPHPRIGGHKAKRRIKMVFAFLIAAMIFLAFSAPALAAEIDTAMTNLITLFLNVATGIGVLCLIWGIVQVGLSFSSHDPSQRSNGFLFVAGGLLVALSPQIAKQLVPSLNVP